MSAVWKALHVSYVWTTGKRSDMYDPGLSVWSYPVRRPTRRVPRARPRRGVRAAASRRPGRAGDDHRSPRTQQRTRQVHDSRYSCVLHFRFWTALVRLIPATSGPGRGRSYTAVYCTKALCPSSERQWTEPPAARGTVRSFDVCRVSGSGHSFSHTVARRTLIAALSRLSQARWLHGFRPFPFPGGWRL